MDISVKRNEGKIEISIIAENSMEWEILKGLVETADPIALTKYLQDKGFVTQGDKVVDALERLEWEMEV